MSWHCHLESTFNYHKGPSVNCESSENGIMRIISNSPSICECMKSKRGHWFFSKSSQYYDKLFKHLQVSTTTCPATGKMGTGEIAIV